MIRQKLLKYLFIMGFFPKYNNTVLQANSQRVNYRYLHFYLHHLPHLPCACAACTCLCAPCTWTQILEF